MDKKKKIFKLIIIVFLVFIYQQFIFAEQLYKEDEIKNLIKNGKYEAALNLLKNIEQKGNHSAELYLLIAYIYNKLGMKGQMFVPVVKGLYYNKNNRDLLDLLDKYCKYKNFIKFPFYVKIPEIVYILLSFICNALIVYFIIKRKNEMIVVILIFLIISLFFFGLYIFYPGISKFAFIISDSVLLKYPLDDSESKVRLEDGLPVKVLLKGKKFSYILIPEGIEGWVENKNLIMVFYDRR